MHFHKLAAVTLLLCALPAVSQARDTAVYLPFDKAVAEATRSGKIDGSVKFYLAGNTPAGKVTVVSPDAVTNIVSFYKRNERKDAQTYECHAGAIMAGVALKGDLAKVQ